MIAESKINIGELAWTDTAEWINSKQFTSYFVMVDSNTYKHCLPILRSKNIVPNFELFIFPAGEINKNLDSVKDFCSWALEKGIDRKSLCIALGGGVVCDLMGFCASILLRGVSCMYIPTSLMALADASVGGKTGINFDGFKNQIGTFKSPEIILCDPVFLGTLNQRNLLNGFVEIIKHSLLNNTPNWNEIIKVEYPLSETSLLFFIEQSIQYKSTVVKNDFYEVGIRKALNFGHTYGHAIESYYLSIQQDILHGEAIALGMSLELQLSSRLFNWKREELNEILNYLTYFTPQRRLAMEDIKGILHALRGDKKRMDGITQFSLLEEIFKPILGCEVNQNTIKEVLENYIQKGL